MIPFYQYAKGQTVTIQNMENELDNAKWRQSKHSLTKTAELVEQNKLSLANCLMVSVLEERVIALCIDETRSRKLILDWSDYIGFQWRDFRIAFKRYTAGNREGGYYPQLDTGMASILIEVLRDLFSDQKLENNNEILDLLIDLEVGAQCARQDEFEIANCEFSIPDSDLEELVKYSSYEKWYRALEQTRIKPSFSHKTLLAFLTEKEKKSYIKG